MAMQERRAEVTWTGNLNEGSGKLRVGSDAFPELNVTFASRTEKMDGTSPEELLAAAHAICYSMVLANMLKQAGSPSETLDVEAVCSLDRTDAGLKISGMQINVSGNVPGIDDAKFDETAQAAEARCPVSNAIRGNVPVTVSAKLGG